MMTLVQRSKRIALAHNFVPVVYKPNLAFNSLIRDFALHNEEKLQSCAFGMFLLKAKCKDFSISCAEKQASSKLNFSPLQLLDHRNAKQKSFLFVR